MKTLFFSFICFVSIGISAQTESDIIVLGGTLFSSNPTVPYRNSILYINSNAGIDSIDATQYLNIGIYTNSASSSTITIDSITYISNGYKIVNKRGESIDEKILTTDFNDGGPGFLAHNQNPLFLSIKHNDLTKIYLFYGEYGYYNPNIPEVSLSSFDKLFSYAELNAYNSIPSQALLSKNNVLLSDSDSTIRGSIRACRHGNGRDWWIFKPGLFTNKFYRGLLTPSGLVMEAYYTSVESFRQVADCGDHFSIDGNKYIHYVPNEPRRVFVYDFDRCTGELSNPVIHDISSWLPAGLHINCISPDGSKIYFAKNFQGQRRIIQFDFQTLQHQELGTGLYPFLSPNGNEIYFMTSVADSTAPNGFSRYLNTIHNPNEKAENLIISWNQYNTINALGRVPPNLAYFRLGAAEGTLCDSLGLSNVHEPEPIHWQLYPNPSSGQINLRMAQWPGGSYSLHNSLGQQVAQAALPAAGNEQIFSLAFQHLPAGLYFLTLRNPQGQILGSIRFIIHKE